MKKAAFLLLLMCLLIAEGFGQVKGTVTDQSTGKPVSFANIWVEDQSIGTTSNEKGQFELKASSLEGKTLIVSCLGYERKLVPVTAAPLKIALKPSAVSLREVTVKRNTARRKAVVNQLDNDTQLCFGSNGTPWIIAQYVPYKPTYSNTPFVDEVAMVTLSNLRKAQFKIRLLEVKENGEPGNDLLTTPLLVTAPKGIKTLRVNLSQYDLLMPSKGFFIAFEWLIIPDNKYEPRDEETGEKLSETFVSYEPSIRTYKKSSQVRHGWIYHQGKWQSTDKVEEGDAIASATPHFQLTLSD
ncbi:carboxypeptidase-like regulatory domain-containing protein [Rufibacter roseus]|uniref:Carboxypeptidase-like regulatory domain-containing protein n=1 Tax=Rufibacter roseus TaxID=1567108 RepID=A0ABW2DFT2_9BACT|nr:carboxypeptidase-like regulatory domain-containing protein [Rufibacter roseus]